MEVSQIHICGAIDLLTRRLIVLLYMTSFWMEEKNCLCRNEDSTNPFYTTP